MSSVTWNFVSEVGYVVYVDNEVYDVYESPQEAKRELDRLRQEEN